MTLELIVDIEYVRDCSPKNTTVTLHQVDGRVDYRLNLPMSVNLPPVNAVKTNFHPNNDPYSRYVLLGYTKPLPNEEYESLNKVFGGLAGIVHNDGLKDSLYWYCLCVSDSSVRLNIKI